jgi:DNA-3-methyladenine glycosylase
MHWCANVVCGPEGVAQAVLLRAGEPVCGVELMAARRPASRPRDLARGPARLCQALDLVGWAGRVGVTAAADRPWRALHTGSPYVSPGRPRVPGDTPGR